MYIAWTDICYEVALTSLLVCAKSICILKQTTSKTCTRSKSPETQLMSSKSMELQDQKHLSVRVHGMVISNRKADVTSEKKKYPRIRPHTTVRYDMAVAADASTSCSAAVRLTPPPYAKTPAHHPSHLISTYSMHHMFHWYKCSCLSSVECW